MLIRVSPKTIAVLLSILLLVVAVSGSVAAESTIYGLSVGEALMLFGNGVPDHDEHPFTDDRVDEIETDGWIGTNELLDGASLKWDYPIDLPQTWNENSFQEEFPSERSTDNSLAPDNDVTNSDYIKHAHATIYSLDPSTKVHTENGSEHHIRPSGDVNSHLDFLVEVPEDKPDESSARQFVSRESQASVPRGHATSVEFSLERAEVEEYDLLVDGEVEDDATPFFDNRPGTGSQSVHTSAHAFEFEDVDGDPTVEVVAVIESGIEVEIDYEYETTVTDSDGNERTVTRTGTTTDMINDDVTVSDGFETVVEDYDGTEVELFELPDGEVVSVVETPEPYSRFEVGGDEAAEGGLLSWLNRIVTDETPPDEVQTDWTFTTTRMVEWDQLMRATETGGTTDTEIINTTENPIQRHVYPTGYGPRVNETDDDDTPEPAYTADLDEPTKDPVELPDDIDANLAANYSDQTTIETQHMRDITGEDFEIYGFVDDDPYVIPAEDIESRDVIEGNLTVEVGDLNISKDRPTEVNVTLTDEDTGEPINFDEAGGEVTITDTPEDKTVDLGSDGEATVRTNTTGTVYGEYTPPEWTESELPTTGDTDFDYDFRLPSGYEMVEWIIGMAIRLLPIFLTLYLITAFREMFHTGKGGQNRPQR